MNVNDPIVVAERIGDAVRRTRTGPAAEPATGHLAARV